MLSNSSSYTERIDQKLLQGISLLPTLVILQEKHQDSILEAFDYPKSVLISVN